MLARTGFGDDSLRTEPHREQRLADRVVDLVRSGVREVLALEPHLGAPAARQFASQRQRRRPPDPGAQLRLELGPELRVAQYGAYTFLEPVESGHQRLRHVTSAEWAEPASLVGERATQRLREQRIAIDFKGLGSHRRLSSIIQTGAAVRAAWMKSRIFTTSLRPRPELDARAYVHAERPHASHRFADVIGIEPTGEDELCHRGDSRRIPPVRPLSRAAACALEQTAPRQKLGPRLSAAKDRQHALSRRQTQRCQVLRVRLHPVRLRSRPRPRRPGPATDAGTRRHVPIRPVRAIAVPTPTRSSRCAARPRETRSPRHRRRPAPRLRSPRAFACRRS